MEAAREFKASSHEVMETDTAVDTHCWILDQKASSGSGSARGRSLRFLLLGEAISPTGTS